MMLETAHSCMHSIVLTMFTMQAIYQDVPETGEVGAVTRRTRNKEENRQYGQWWGARATGSCSGVDELTWFIRLKAVAHSFGHAWRSLLAPVYAAAC